MIRFFKVSWNIAWAFTLVALPVTSFPILSKLAGGTLVSPLSIIPLIWLVLTWIPYFLIKTQTIPGELKPFISFILVVIISCGLAFFIRFPVYKGHSIHRDELEALLSLGMGVAFLLITITRLGTVENLRRSLSWINLGGIFFITWSIFQLMTIWFFNGNLNPVMDTIQKNISVGNLNQSVQDIRISGLTLEPSWLAHSLNMLYLPLWLAASRYKVSAYQFRIWKISVENFLFFLGIIVMLMTYSRIGLVGFLAIMAWFVIDLANRLTTKVAARRKTNGGIPSWLNRISVIGGLMISLLIVFVILLFFLSFQDNRLKKIFSWDSEKNFYTRNNISLITIAKSVNFGERVVYWDFGWKIFSEYPLFGVGLGNAGRFVEETISPEAWKMGEVRHALLYESQLPNTKSLWVRLLSETGIIGFSLFITWLIILWITSRSLEKSKIPIIKMIGMAGQFVLIAQIFEGFSLDTFALPYLWISLGLVIASNKILRDIDGSTKSLSISVI